MSATDLVEREPLPLLLAVEKAAFYIGLGRTETYELIRTGELESVKVGRRRLVPTAACVDFVERTRSAAKAAA